MGFPEDLGLGIEEPRLYKLIIPVQETWRSWRFEIEHNTSHDRYLSYLLPNGTALMADSTEARETIDSNCFYGSPQAADVEFKRRLELYNSKSNSKELRSWRKIGFKRWPTQEET